MLVLQPRRVEFGSSTWGQVSSVTVARKPERVFAEFADGGSHVVLADVPEQRVTVTVWQELLADDIDEPKPGEQALLRFETAPNSAGASSKTVTMTCVVTAVSYRLSQKGGATREIDLLAVSADGVTDPIVVA